MAPAKKPFVLLEPELLRGLYGALHFAASNAPARKAGELRWTLAPLVATARLASSGDIVAFRRNRTASALFHSLLGEKVPGATSLPSRGSNADISDGTRIAGMAEALRALGSGVVVIFSGDAASLDPEALAHSAQHRLPILWITQTAAEASEPVPVDGLRPRLPRVATDAEDTVAIYRVLDETIRQARTGGGPTWLDLQTGVPDTTPAGVRQPARKRGAELSAEKMRQYLADRRLLPSAVPKVAAKAGPRPAVLEL